MGSFNESCGFSGLPIVSDTPVRMMAIRRVPKDNDMTHDAFCLFEPVSYLVRGKYNDYGWIEFEDGEEDRFFNSLKSMGINPVMRDNNGSGVELPSGVFLWFMLEEAFQLAGQIVIEYLDEKEFKYIPISETLEPAFKAWREFRDVHRSHLTKVVAQAATQDDYDEAFRMEDAAKRHLGSKAYSLRTKLTIAARDARNVEASEQALIDVFDLERVNTGLYEIRRPLAPNLSGGQGYNDDAQKLLAAFVARQKDPYEDD